MIDESVWTGVQSLIDDYAQIAGNDRVIIAYTPDCLEAAAWVSVALEMRDIAVRRLPMAPLFDDGFRERFARALPLPDEPFDRLAVITFERDTMSHTNALRDLLSRFDSRRCRVFRAISTCDKLFSDALRVTPDHLSARNASILDRLGNARNIRVTTEGGTDLRIQLDSAYRWISNRGVWRPGSFVILPAGEVATFPAAISGTLVADFAFNVNAITERDSRLDTHPVSVTIEDGRAVSYTCADAAVTNFLDESFRTHCAYNVGELGFGTNTHITAPIALNSHINERRPGVHLGFGQHNQGPEVGYQCRIHLDLIAKGGMIWVEDETTPLDLENVPLSLNAHPTYSRDEDVFSPELEDLEVDDCCGILSSEGFQLFEPRCM